MKACPSTGSDLFQYHVIPAQAGIQRFTLRALSGIVIACVAELAMAQQVPTDPTSTHIFPAGGRRGTQVNVRVGGECLPPGTRFRFFGDGVSAPVELGEPAIGQYAPSPRRKPGEQPMTYPREWHSQIQLDADASLGVKLWRLSCARGGTGGRPFIVGDLPEFIETEPNSQAEQSELVQMPVTINGQIAGESDLDYFRFQAKAGEIVSVDVAAARLGSILDPLVQVIGPDGLRVAADESRIGADPVLAFRAAVSGEYQLLISNITFKGGPSYVYRITLSTAPLIQYAFPPGGQVATTRDIDFFALTGDGSRHRLSDRVTFPASPGEFWRRGPQEANANPLVVSDLPESVEAADNVTRDKATPIDIPQIVSGQFETINDEDWYRIACQKDVPLTIECSSYPRWSPALPVVAITNADGGVLATASAVQPPRGIIRLEWQPPADGHYWLRLRDLQQGVRGGTEFIYRLRVQRAVPDFSITLKSDVINVVQGGRVEVDVAIERRGGFTAGIELAIEGLPTGIRVEGVQVAARQPTAKLVLIADAEARSGDLNLRIKGKAEINGQVVEHLAQATHLGHDVDGVGLGTTEVDHVQLTIVHKPVFKLYCNEAYQYAHRGTIYPYLMEVERLDGFDGPIRIQMADRQIKDLDGIEIPPTTVAPGQSQFLLPLFLPETMHINVQAHSNVYAQGHVEFQDKFGQKQTLLVVSTMRCMIRTLPTVVKLRPVNRDLGAQPGGTLRCPLALDRTSHFTGPMQIELVSAVPGITAETATIGADQTEAEVVIHVAPTMTPSKNVTLKFRALGNMSGDAKVVSETKVSLGILDEEN